MANSNINVQVLIDQYAVAGEDLEAYRGVVVDADGVASYPASVGDRITGMTEGSVKSGEQVRVIKDGQVPAQISATANVAYGAKLQANTVGKLAVVASTNDVSAIALATPSSADDVIQVRVSDLIQETAA